MQIVITSKLRIRQIQEITRLLGNEADPGFVEVEDATKRLAGLNKE